MSSSSLSLLHCYQFIYGISLFAVSDDTIIFLYLCVVWAQYLPVRRSCCCCCGCCCCTPLDSVKLCSLCKRKDKNEPPSKRASFLSKRHSAQKHTKPFHTRNKRHTNTDKQLDTRNFWTTQISLNNKSLYSNRPLKWRTPRSSPYFQQALAAMQMDRRRAAIRSSAVGHSRWRAMRSIKVCNAERGGGARRGGIGAEASCI